MKQRSHVIQLKPNNQQTTYFEKACGCQRFVYNWGLAAWKTEYEDGNKPIGRGLKKQFNAIKKTEFPWIYEVTKCVVDTVVLEDLNVKGMLKNRHLSKAVSRSNFHKIKQFLQYKCGDVRFVDRFYPGSKTCSSCGRIKDMPLHLRVYECRCGLKLDRDLNAAINILRAGCPEVKPVETRALAAGNGGETVACEAGNTHKQVTGDKGAHYSFL